MKNGIFEKARRRVIKALGGYTSDEILFRQRPIVKQYEKVPQRLGISFAYMYCEEVPDSEERRKWMLKECAADLAEAILDKNLYTLRMIDRIDTAVRTEEHYELTVEILPPVDWGDASR